MKRIGSNGYVLGSTGCLLEGGFDRPSTILLDLKTAASVKQGVLEITSQRLSGRIGVLDNGIISGAIIDGTGETGVGAVYKLLLVPGGRYLYRFPQKTETWDLNQDLALESTELEQILAGPSAIGLARPAPQFTSPEIEWDERAIHASMYIKDCHRLLTALFAERQKALAVTKRQDVVYAEKKRSVLERAEGPSSASREKHRVSLRTARRNGLRRRNDLSREEGGPDIESRISPAAHMCMLFVLLAVGSLLLVPLGSWSKLNCFGREDLSETESASARKTAPFLLPAASSEPPPREVYGSSRGSSGVSKNSFVQAGGERIGTPTASAHQSHDAFDAASSRVEPSVERPGPGSPSIVSPLSSHSSETVDVPLANNESTGPAYYGSTADGSISSAAPFEERSDSTVALKAVGDSACGAPANSSAGDGRSALTERSGNDNNVSFWIKRVKLNPNDAVARKYLAYSLLYNGNPRASVQQFRALMSIRALDVSETQSYRDALALCMVSLK